MKALVTGGTGFIGSNLVSRLVKDCYDVFMTGRQGELAPTGFKGKMLDYDFSNINWQSVGDIDVLFHEAAITDTTCYDRDEMFRVNVDNAMKLFDDAYKHGCRKFVFASSTAVYGNGKPPFKEDRTPIVPLNIYAESKKSLELKAMWFAHKNSDATVVGLRYCNVYGPGEFYKQKTATLIYQLAQQMIDGDPKLFKWGEQKRDYVYVKDVVEANILASKSNENCIVNCGTGTATSFNDLVVILNNLLALNRKPVYIDNPYSGVYQNWTQCDTSLAKEKIGFTPKFNLRTGIEDYLTTGLLVKMF